MTTTEDLGLGTAYERVAIYDLFDRWTKHRPVTTACEGPLDGMAGIPGLHLLGLARKGARVEVSLPDDAALAEVRGVYERCGAGAQLTTTRLSEGKFPTGNYELAVSYNALPLVGDWREYLGRFFAIRAQRYIVVVSNPSSYGVQLRRLQRLSRGERTKELFDHEATHREVIEPALRRYGRILRHDYLDCPWWPDFLIPAKKNLAGDLLKGIRQFTGGASASRESRGFIFGKEKYPFFSDQEGFAEMKAALRLHPAFDHAPVTLARTFGHLHGYLVGG